MFLILLFIQKTLKISPLRHENQEDKTKELKYCYVLKAHFMFSIREGYKSCT